MKIEGRHLIYLILSTLSIDRETRGLDRGQPCKGVMDRGGHRVLRRRANETPTAYGRWTRESADGAERRARRAQGTGADIS